MHSPGWQDDSEGFAGCLVSSVSDEVNRIARFYARLNRPPMSIEMDPGQQKIE
jgi:hypothetical protein